MAASRSSRVTRSSVGINGLDENFCGRTLRNRSIAQPEESSPPPVPRARSPKKKQDCQQHQQTGAQVGKVAESKAEGEPLPAYGKRGLPSSEKDESDKSDYCERPRAGGGPEASPALKRAKRCPRSGESQGVEEEPSLKPESPDPAAPKENDEGAKSNTSTAPQLSLDKEAEQKEDSLAEKIILSPQAGENVKATNGLAELHKEDSEVAALPVEPCASPATFNNSSTSLLNGSQAAPSSPDPIVPCRSPHPKQANESNSPQIDCERNCMPEDAAEAMLSREPAPTLDSDGESNKPPPPRGRGCGRKRKGTPVKVCDRVFATEDEEESMSENSYGPEKGDGCEDKHGVPAADEPYYETQSAQLCVSEEGSSGVRGAVSYPPPPNCRIREVHCGNQVRLIVIAIRDITKGEEITVDYSLTEWGENAVGFNGTVPPSSFDCSSDHESNIKKEEESCPIPVSLSVSEYLTPSWSLSPSSSPLSHSEPSDSDLDSDDANGEMRMRPPHRRKRHKALSSPAAHAKRKAPQRPPSHPPSFPLSIPTSPLQPIAPSRPVFKCPPPAGVPSNSVRVSVGRGQSTMAQKQRCVYCGRHFRSLPRHLNKHHSHQPDVRSALQQAHASGNPHCVHSSLPSSSKHSQCPQVAPVPGVVVVTPQSPPSSSLSPVRRSPTLCSPTRRCPAPALTTPPRGGVPVSVLKRSPPTPATPPRKGGRKMKRENEEVDIFEKTKEVVPTSVFMGHVKESESLKEEREYNGGREEESGAEDKTDLSSSRRPHMLPLLSSLSSLVLYLRRLQHSAFISLSRSPQSAEAWRLLCHSSLALLILYNRRRECEVSKLTISEYQARVTPQCPIPMSPGAPPALTPLEASLSPFERMVLPHLPRVGVQGKRGRVQPLILPPHSEACLEVLLQTRAGVGIDPQNPYMFARPYHSPATPLRGTDLLRSLARSSGTQHPRALTQTRVRRQVAILTQLLLLSEGEEEGHRGAATQRLESFLQKEYHVTQSCATIGQDPGLMGLIGRVVLCGERDGVLFRGMSLHHICLELDVLSGNSADSLSEESDVEQGKENPQAPSPATTIMMKKTTSNSKSPRLKKMNSSSLISTGRKKTGQPKPGKRGVLKRPWSEAERAAVESHLVQNIMELRVPAKADCERCLELCPLLVTNHRDWRAVKFYCHNRIQLLKKTQQSLPCLSAEAVNQHGAGKGHPITAEA